MFKSIVEFFTNAPAKQIADKEDELVRSLISKQTDAFEKLIEYVQSDTCRFSYNSFTRKAKSTGGALTVNDQGPDYDIGFGYTPSCFIRDNRIRVRYSALGMTFNEGKKLEKAMLSKYTPAYLK